MNQYKNQFGSKSLSQSQHINGAPNSVVSSNCFIQQIDSSLTFTEQWHTTLIKTNNYLWYGLQLVLLIQSFGLLWWTPLVLLIQSFDLLWLILLVLLIQSFDLLWWILLFLLIQLLGLL